MHKVISFISVNQVIDLAALSKGDLVTQSASLCSVHAQWCYLDLPAHIQSPHQLFVYNGGGHRYVGSIVYAEDGLLCGRRNRLGL